MIDYIKSEVYRATKDKAFRILLLLTALLVVIVLVWSGVRGDMFSEGLPVMDFWSGMSLIGSIILYAVALLFTYKTKDTKIQILSYGISRWKMYIWDFISFQIISIAGIVIMGLMAVLFTKFGELVGLVSFAGDYGLFAERVGGLILFGINLTMACFGTSYILGSASLGIVSHILFIPSILKILVAFNHNKPHILDLLIKFMRIQPYDIFLNYMYSEAISWETLAYSLIYIVIVFFLTGLVRYSKQEIY